MYPLDGRSLLPASLSETLPEDDQRRAACTYREPEIPQVQLGTGFDALPRFFENLHLTTSGTQCHKHASWSPPLLAPDGVTAIRAGSQALREMLRASAGGPCPCRFWSSACIAGSTPRGNEGVAAQLTKLCQELCRYSLTLARATDAGFQRFRRSSGGAVALLPVGPRPVQLLEVEGEG